MSQPDIAPPKFTNQRISFKGNDSGAKRYEEIPELMSGKLQAQCQQAFRHYLQEGKRPLFVSSTITAQASLPVGDLPTIALNAAYALSTPCEDIAEILEFVESVCDSVGMGCLKHAQEFTRRISAANPVNPYRVFKQTPVKLWPRLDVAYAMLREGTLMKLAVIFDDGEMIQKCADHDPAGYVKALSLALAEVAYDPLSNARSWIDSPHSVTFQEIARRVNLQFNSIRSPLDSQYFLSRTRPDLAKGQGFMEGIFDIKSLRFDSTDHLLRHIPRYQQYLAVESESIGRGIQDLNILNNGNPERERLAVRLIEDMVGVGLTIEDIYFRYCKRMLTGEIMDLADGKGLQNAMVLDILDLSGRLDDVGDTERTISLALLKMADPDLVKMLAVTDVQLRTAFMATKDSRFLERLSGTALDKQIGVDLGL
ncbi:hypothetical protein [Pseudomonas amygdali]|uniref:Uncharacterized protein n=2 Tax=Pseudomonas amygdali pv. lachrymans TaxID=53707 RepID=A0ABR5KRW6_PSEAV|nr:hypothetical protein [Pseudomonas amygdali]AXH60112.1 hypothetical protein PLA107_033420 [Pseudomonas amygdali pv. lachrymans str. M301315]KPC17518.1 Uncharacterized protein AC499_0720 [Pseudomonas amygdali pv. lachrymans]